MVIAAARPPQQSGIAVTSRQCEARAKCWGVFQGVAEVKIQEGESIESALRRFKRKVQQEDIIKDIKKHSFYLKPGDKRRAKQALARKRNRKKLRRELE
jgi:small subunit ribosomal protein S21